MRKSPFMASAALGAMTAAERQVGRYMRSPDHPAPAAPAADAPPEPAPAAEEPAAPAAPAKAQTTDDLYEAEFGAAKFGEEEGDAEPPAPAEPAEPEAAPAEPEGAAVQKEEPGKPATPSLEDRLAAAESAAEEARREARELREQLQPKPKVEQEQPQEPSPTDGRPNPEDYDFGEADSAYITDLAEWTAEKRFEALMAERDQKSEQKADFAEMQSNWDAQISAPEVAEQYPDFQQKVVEGADRGDWHCSPVMTVAIKSSPVARDIAYELANNAAESKRIASLHPNEQILEIGRLEGKHLYLASERQAAADPTPTPAPAPVKPSKAPAPPPARARGAGGQFSTELDQTYDRMLTEFK